MTEQSDLADDLLLEEVPQHVEPPRRPFMPWHKVRKQLVRSQQWNTLVRRLLDRHWRQHIQRRTATSGSLMNKNALQCLVIPGDDLLDVRSMWKELQDDDVVIRYLGFNIGSGSDDKSARVHVANNEVTSLDGVVKDSRVFHGAFEAIRGGENRSSAELRRFGPYHVVNLDLCGSLLPNNSAPYGEYYDALHALLAYQFKHQRLRWLLFVTTMTEASDVDVEGLDSLCHQLKQNVVTHPEFATQLDELVPHEGLIDATGRLNISALSEAQLVNLFGIGFGKWLLQLCLSARPQWTVEMRRSYRYTINAEKEVRMLSLAFEFLPDFSPPVDSSGMSTQTVTIQSAPSEATLAKKLAVSVGNIKDADALLAEDADLFARTRDAAADLMAESGISRQKYLEWVEAGEPPSGPEVG